MLTHRSFSLVVKMRGNEANDVLTSQGVRGSAMGFQWPSMTFPNSSPHPPPAHCGCFCKTLPAVPSWSSMVTVQVSWRHIFLFSLVRLVCPRLRSLVLLKSTDFQSLKNLWSLLRERNYAWKEVHGSFHVVARASPTCRDTDTLPCLHVSSPYLVNIKSFLFIPCFFHNLLLSSTHACLPLHWCKEGFCFKSHPSVHFLSCCPVPLPVWSF